MDWDMAEITQADYDLVAVGGTAGGLSVAMILRDSGLGAIRILEAIEVDGNGLVGKSRYKCAVMCSQRFRG